MDRSPPQLDPIAELPPSEVEKITAGEVVERPLNVVKELIENSLDAHATEITVELEDGGKQLVRVTDNGAGIPFDELPLAFKPHHTSKIRSLDDVYHLSTLGFRGEALGSIAAVSKLSLASHREGEDLGGLIEVTGGELVSHSRMNIHSGTSVEVRDLFFNTPVRLKFLRSRQSETGMVSKLLTSYALAYPEIKWRLESSGKALLKTSGDGDRRAVLADIAGDELAGALIEIDFEFPPSAARGFVSAPQHHRHNRARQWYFVNGRPVANKLLFRAADDAVREFISPGKFPAGVFFLELPPEEIDVNVHPMKTEVSFAQPQGVYSLLATAIRRALGSAAQERQRQLSGGLSSVIQPVDNRLSPRPVEPDQGPPLDTGQRPIPLTTAGPPSFTAGPGMPAGPEEQAQHSLDSASPPPIPSYAGDGFGAAAVDRPELEELREGGYSVSQVANSYLVVTTAEAVYLVDQHAAHERILFESLYREYTSAGSGGVQRQQLLFPLLISLTPDEAQLAQDYIAALGRIGLAAKLAAGRNLIVSEVPAVLEGLITAEVIHGLLEDLESGAPGNNLIDDQIKELTASLACRAAVKANQHLPVEEREMLLARLLANWSSLSCPHGRPTIIRWGPAELAKIFLR